MKITERARVIAAVVFFINTVVMFLLPILIMNYSPSQNGMHNIFVHPEMYVSSIGLGLMSINIFCAGLIFAGAKSKDDV